MAAVLLRELAAHVLAHQRPKVLVHIAVPAAVVGRALVVGRIVDRQELLEQRQRGAELRGHDCTGDPAPHSIHDRGAWVVDLTALNEV